MTMNINTALLCADIRAIAGQIKALKAVLGTRWQRPMGSEQQERCRLKERATELLALLAFARGKLHRQKPPRGTPCDWSAMTYHQRIAERLGPIYSVALQESA